MQGHFTPSKKWIMCLTKSHNLVPNRHSLALSISHLIYHSGFLDCSSIWWSILAALRIFISGLFFSFFVIFFIPAFSQRYIRICAFTNILWFLLYCTHLGFLIIFCTSIFITNHLSVCFSFAYFHSNTFFDALDVFNSYFEGL